MLRCRTLVEEPRYAREAIAINPDTRRMDEVLHDVTWALSHDLGVGQETGVDDIWAMPVDASPFGPAVVIYYTFSRDEVHLLSIRKADTLANLEEVVL